MPNFMKKTPFLLLTCGSLMLSQCAFSNGDDDYVGSKRADNVRDLTPVEAKYIVAPSATSVQFKNNNEEVKKVKAGDIIVSDINTQSPNGFIKKVVAVAETGDTKTIATEPVSITEAVVDGQSNAEGILNPAGDNSLLTGATYNPLNGKVETITPQAGVTVYGVKQPVNAIPECKSKKWYVEFNNVNIQNAGTINGCVIPWEVVPSVKVDELTKFHTQFDPSLTALYTTTFVMAMNKAKYDSLPPDLKKVIDNNSGMATSAWLGKIQQDNDPLGRKAAVDRKNTIFTVSVAEAQEFRRKSRAIEVEWVEDMNKRGHDGRKLLDTARALIDKHGKGGPVRKA